MESIATLLFWCVGRIVKLSPLHGDDTGSIPARITVLVAQLVKASDCESEDCDFKFHLTPNLKNNIRMEVFMYRSIIYNKSPEELQEILDNSSSFSEV